MNEKLVKALVDDINGSPQRVRDLVEGLLEIKTYLKGLPTSTNMIIYEIIQKALKGGK